MYFIADNLRFIRKKHGLTQAALARQLGVKRSMIGAYEEGRADPRISFLLLVSEKFGYSLDQLISKPLDHSIEPSDRITGKGLRLLPIAIDPITNKEKVVLVPLKAAAGYLNGFGDVAFIEQLPAFELPFPELSNERTYRIFQIQGDSMLPIPSGAYLMCSYLLDWRNIKNDECYVLISKSEGIVFKRLLNNLSDGHLVLKSDNPAFESYKISSDEVAEVWKVEGFTSFQMDSSMPYSRDTLLQELRLIRKQLQNRPE